jgi:hypothetical protein
MTIVNCTPHAVNIVSPTGETIATFPRGEIIPRLTQTTVTVGEMGGIPITETQFGETVGLPAPVEGTYLIVSRIVLSANMNRQDLLVPNGVVRDAAGNIIGCESLARN